MRSMAILSGGPPIEVSSELAERVFNTIIERLQTGHGYY